MMSRRMSSRRAAYLGACTGLACALLLLSSCSLSLGGGSLPPASPRAVSPSEEAARRDLAFARADGFFRGWLAEKMSPAEIDILNAMPRPMSVRLHDPATGWRREWTIHPAAPGKVTVSVDGEHQPMFRFAMEQPLFLGVVSGEQGPTDAMSAFHEGEVSVEIDHDPAAMFPILRVMLDFIARHPYR